MKWITRENAKADCIACPSLIRRFVFARDDRRKIEFESPVYDALDAWCQHRLRGSGRQ